MVTASKVLQAAAYFPYLLNLNCKKSGGPSSFSVSGWMVVTEERLLKMH